MMAMSPSRTTESSGIRRRKVCAALSCSSLRAQGIVVALAVEERNIDMKGHLALLTVAALALSGTVLLAFDEFQCLNPALLPIAIED